MQSEATLRGIEFVPLSKFSRKAVVDAIRSFKPDIIHSHDVRATVYASALGKSCTVIGHLHNLWPWGVSWNVKTILFNLAAYRARRIILVNGRMRDQLALSALVRKKCIDVPNAIDLGAVQRQIIPGEKKVDLIFVGRLVAQKDPLTFLEVVKRLKCEYADIRAVMLGRGELEVECREFIRKNALECNVVMKGFVNTPLDDVATARLLVFPSIYEGFGLAVAEALALGVPTLCRPILGPGDMVQDSVTGFLCSSVDEFTERCRHLLNDSGQLRQFSHAAKNAAKGFRDWTAYGSEIEGIYNDCIGRKKCSI